MTREEDVGRSEEVKLKGVIEKRDVSVGGRETWMMWLPNESFPLERTIRRFVKMGQYRPELPSSL